MSGIDLYSSVLDDCSRPGDARIAPQAKKCCEIWANYDGNLLKLSIRQPLSEVLEQPFGQHLLEQVLTQVNHGGQRLWRAVLIQLY